MSEDSNTTNVDVSDQVETVDGVDEAVESAESAPTEGDRMDGDTMDATDVDDDVTDRGADDVSRPTGGDDTDGDDADSDAGADDTDDEETDGAVGAGATPRQGGRRAGLVREGEVAADFLETLLDIADLDGDIDLGIDGDRATVAIVDSEDGRVPRRLVGQDGKCLEALQELTRLAVQASTGERSRLMLDVAGHRAARREVLVGLANEAIDKVKESSSEVAMEPMSAFERKVVHDVVLAAGLASESSGVEPRRYVVVLPA